MAIVSKPVIAVAVVAVLCAGVFYFQPDRPPAATKLTRHAHSKAKTKDDEVPQFTHEDFVKRFPRLKIDPRNIFLAPNLAAKSGVVLSKEPLQKVPSELAGGNPNWIFTGVATLDGEKMALLENGTTHEGAYVTVGSLWKLARIRRISTDGIALTPKSGGSEEIVFRYRPTEIASGPKTTTAISGPTLPPAGPIAPMAPMPPNGGGRIIRRMARGLPPGVVIQSGGD
jgi:hypothetical protein